MSKDNELLLRRQAALELEVDVRYGIALAPKIWREVGNRKEGGNYGTKKHGCRERISDARRQGGNGR